MSSLLKNGGSVSISVGPSQGNGAFPRNTGTQLTVERVTPFAFAKVAPLLPAADLRR